jgi:CRISPR-associated protein Csd1
MMALLANIQQTALPGVGAGVVQRYYAAASATPALVLGRLVRLSQTGHLPKIEGGLRYWFDDQLAQVWGLLERRIPATLTLEEQTLFAMGYYQQKAKRTTSNKADATAVTEN